MNSITIVFASLLIAAGSAFAATGPTFTKSERDWLNAPPQKIEAIDTSTLGVNSLEQIQKLASDEKSSTNRHPASEPRVPGSADMLSPEYVTFRDKIIHASNGYEFAAILKEYDDKYDNAPDSMPNDLKYIVAHMATMRPLQGVVWRMVPLVHHIVVSQEMLLGMIRNMTENALIRDSSGNIRSQMAFFAMPAPTLPYAKLDTFNTEGDLMTFLASDVRKALLKGIKRLENLKMTKVDPMTKRETPIVFDAQIRFGDQAFPGNDWSAYDRYKILGDAERFATIGRYHRRLAIIEETVAYNWNGYMLLVQTLGRRYGIGNAAAQVQVNFGMNSNPFIEGLTRKERVSITRSAPFRKLWTLVPGDKGGGAWMKLSYKDFQDNVTYMRKAWDLLKKDASGTSYAQLDPEIFDGRKDQFEAGMVNLEHLVQGNCDSGGGGSATIKGAITGEPLQVNMKGYYCDNPPNDLKNLLATQFEGNESVQPMKAMFPDIANDPKKPDVFTMTYNGKKVEFRNYFYGRAIGWDASANAYGTLFPGQPDIGKARRILAEARGTRLLTNSVMLTVR